MPRVSAAFFVTGALFVLAGMSLGMWMGANQDFRLTPVHAHINLVGWVTMALYGTFYALTAKTLSKRLAWINYGLAVVGLLIMAPSLSAFLLTQDKSYIGPLSIGEGITALGLLTFLISAFRELLRKRDAKMVEVSAPVRMAAE